MPPARSLPTSGQVEGNYSILMGFISDCTDFFSRIHIIHLRTISQRKRNGGKQAGLPMGNISGNIRGIRFRPSVLPYVVSLDK